MTYRPSEHEIDLVLQFAKRYWPSCNMKARRASDAFVLELHGNAENRPAQVLSGSGWGHAFLLLAERAPPTRQLHMPALLCALERVSSL